MELPCQSRSHKDLDSVGWQAEPSDTRVTRDKGQIHSCRVAEAGGTVSALYTNGVSKSRVPQKHVVWEGVWSQTVLWLTMGDSEVSHELVLTEQGFSQGEVTVGSPK